MYKIIIVLVAVLSSLGCVSEKREETLTKTSAKEVKMLYFGATWCPPCRRMKPLFEDKDVKKELKKVDFHKYDVDDKDSPDEYYKVTSLPTIIVISKGTRYRYTGGKTKSQILSIISKHTR